MLGTGRRKASRRHATRRAGMIHTPLTTYFSTNAYSHFATPLRPADALVKPANNGQAKRSLGAFYEMCPELIWTNLREGGDRFAGLLATLLHYTLWGTQFQSSRVQYYTTTMQRRSTDYTFFVVSQAKLLEYYILLFYPSLFSFPSLFPTLFGHLYLTCNLCDHAIYHSLSELLVFS